MSESIVLDAELRTDLRKGASRRLRHDNKVPAIIYGGKDDPVAVTLPHNVILKHIDDEAFYTHIIDIKVGKNTEQAIVRDVQRHPYKLLVMHLDFQRVDAKTKLHMHVPIHFENEEKCAGVKAGGILSKTITELEVTCLPKDMPEFISVDVAGLALGDSIHLSELSFPKGVESVALSHGGDHDTSIVSVQASRASKEDEEDDAAEAGEEGAAEE